jgi:hypothetical protein
MDMGAVGYPRDAPSSTARFDYAVTRAEQEYAGMSEPTAFGLSGRRRFEP